MERDKYCVDRVFDYSTSQMEIFDEIKGKLELLVNNNKLTFIAQGMTGSGKTHTILGNKEDPGMLSNCVS